MKRTVISVISLTLCVLFAALCFSGCGDTKNDTTAATETAVNAGSPLFGSWESQEAAGTIYSFGADGKGMLNSNGVPMEFDYVDKGGTVELTFAGTSSAQRFDYSVDGEILSMTDPASETTLTYAKK